MPEFTNDYSLFGVCTQDANAVPNQYIIQDVQYNPLRGTLTVTVQDGCNCFCVRDENGTILAGEPNGQPKEFQMPAEMPMLEESSDINGPLGYVNPADLRSYLIKIAKDLILANYGG